MTRPAAGAYRAALAEHVLGKSSIPEVDNLRSATLHEAIPTRAAAEALMRGDAPPPVREYLYPADLARLSRLNREAERTPEKPPRWRSARAALQEWATFRADKATSKSPSIALVRAIDEAKGSEGSLREREEPVRYDQRGSEWVVEVAQAIAEAYLEPWVISTYPVRVELDVETCRAVMLASVVGKLIVPSVDKRPNFCRAVADKPGEDRTRGGARAWRKHEGTEWVTQDEDAIAAEVYARRGVRLTAGDVRRIVAAGLRAVAEYLAGDESNPRGLVPRPKPRAVTPRGERSGDMGLVQDACDLEGWKDIAACLGVPVRTAQRWARREERPMPVTSRGGVARASTARLTAWVQEEFAGATPGGGG